MTRGPGPSAMFKNLPKSAIGRQISRLNMISGSPETAFRFNPDIRKIELYLIKDSVLGSAIGLKKFWRQNLPTLKFHNQDVDFLVTRIKTQQKEDLLKCPTKILIYYSNSNKSEIECSNKHHSDILKELVDATGAAPVPESEIPVMKRN